MGIKEFIENRKSIREYKNKKFSSKDIKEIKNKIESINKEAEKYGVKIIFFEDGNKIYETLKGNAGYTGVMYKSPYYIGLDIGDGDKNAYIFGGYYLEKINVQVQEMEFGTCWISLYTTDNEVKKEAFSDSYKNIISILSLGYEVGQTVFENEIYSSRLELEEYVFLNSFKKPAEISFLSSRGLSDIFYHVKYAPSALNRQPWRYLIKDNRILLYIENFENETDYLDSGVAMFYLKTLLEQDGIFSSWDIEAPEVDYENKKYIAQITY